MRKLGLLALATLPLVIGCGSNQSRALAESPAPDTSRPDSAPPIVEPATEELRQFFPGHGPSLQVDEPFPHLRVLSPDSSLLGFQVRSDHARTTSDGFCGPVPVVAFLDSSGALFGIKVLENFETPAYLELALEGDLLERLKAYRTGQEDTLDAVTMATRSSTAIIRATTGIVDRVKREILAQ